MGKLIDIDRLCNDLVKRWSIADKKKEDLIRAVMADVVTPIVVSQPPVDAVKVVRCKDCKMFYMKKDILGKVPWCKAWHRGTIETMFCGWGKRKDGNDE